MELDPPAAAAMFALGFVRDVALCRSGAFVGTGPVDAAVFTLGVVRDAALRRIGAFAGIVGFLVTGAPEGAATVGAPGGAAVVGALESAAVIGAPEGAAFAVVGTVASEDAVCSQVGAKAALVW